MVKAEEKAIVGKPPIKEKAVFAVTYKLKDEMHSKIFSDQTGRFTVTSFCGNQYVMMLLLSETTSDNALAEAMCNRTAWEMVQAYQVLVDRLHENKIFPELHALDNECSAEFKAATKHNKMTFQLVPPHDHRRNGAEKSIQTFKDHFVSVLFGADESFPLQLWCQILCHTENQLDLMRKSGTNPSISAFVHMSCMASINTMCIRGQSWGSRWRSTSFQSNDGRGNCTQR